MIAGFIWRGHDYFNYFINCGRFKKKQVYSLPAENLLVHNLKYDLEKQTYQTDFILEITGEQDLIETLALT